MDLGIGSASVEAVAEANSWSLVVVACKYSLLRRRMKLDGSTDIVAAYPRREMVRDL